MKLELSNFWSLSSKKLYQCLHILALSLLLTQSDPSTIKKCEQISDFPVLVGANIYWLGLDANYIDGQLQVSYPSYEAIDSSLAFAKEKLGANAIRSFGAISLGCSLCFESEKGVYHSKALERFDYAISQADKLGLKILTPLIDGAGFPENGNYYHGGISTYLKWFNKQDSTSFYADPEIIAHTKRSIAEIMNHINPYTGLAYKDQPNLIFQLGNELNAPTAWQIEMSNYLRQFTNLVVDGNSSITKMFRAQTIENTNLCTIDTLSLHAYPMDLAALRTAIHHARESGKWIIIDELNWNGVQEEWEKLLFPSADLTEYLALIEENSDIIKGVMLWNLRDHGDIYSIPLSYEIHTQQLELELFRQFALRK